MPTYPNLYRLATFAFSLWLTCVAYGIAPREADSDNSHQITCRITFSPREGVLPLVSATLAQATSQVEIAMFYLSDDEVIDLLCDLAFNRGISINLLTDESMATPANRPVLTKLRQNGVHVRVAHLPSGGKMHLKCAVIDREIVLTGSANWSTAANESNFEDTIVINSRKVAQAYLRRIKNLSADATAFTGPILKDDRYRRIPVSRQLPGTQVKVNRMRAFFTPGRKALQVLVAQLEKAQTVDIGMYLLSDKILVETLKSIASTSQVRLAVDSEMLNVGSIRMLQELWESGVNLYTLHKDRASLHLKTAVIDSQYVWTGSANWTKSALNENAEDIVVFDSPEMAKAYSAFLEDLFASCHSFRKQALVKIEDDTVSVEGHPDLPTTVARSNFENITRGLYPAFTNVGQVAYVADEAYQPVLLDLINSAHQSILVLMYTFPEQKRKAPVRDEVIDALIKAARNGIYVYLVLYTPLSTNDRLADDHSNWAEKLRREGIDVRLALPNTPLHAKMIVVDLAKILVGSHNWSEGALSGKRVYESSALIVLKGQEPKFADYVFSRKVVSDMRNREQWEREIVLLRHLHTANANERKKILSEAGVKTKSRDGVPTL